ncbi:MAG: hypothetical protein HY361_02800 [Candidatus Aenigmarchaeota archaeon]|nr:hypothetical protein [Candidatus Aenigmarchaeota archaeon]
MKNKAFVVILEMITVIAALLVAFGILFPGFFYQNRWEQAFIILKGRDVVTTMDRLGALYQYSFNESALMDFLNKTVPTKLTNLIHWSGTSGTFKPLVTVACVCTEAQKNALISWIGRLRLNGRYIDIDVVSSGLNPIYSASDVLLIWGDQDLTPYKTNLQDYLRAGKGIVEIMDLNGLGDLGDVQKSIFGIDKCSALSLPTCNIVGPPPEDIFVKPDLAKRTTYPTYKNFHHIPMSVLAPNEVASFNNGALAACASTNINQGIFTMRGTSNTFWICNGNSVYFDTTGDNVADILVLPNNQFTIDGQQLLLSFIDGNVRIGITLLDGYKFKNFIHSDTKLYPIDKDVFKILLSDGNYTTSPNPPSENPIPVVIVNGTISRAAWISNFARTSLSDAGDDHKLLLASLLLWASDKKHISTLSDLRSGYLTSYVNIANQNMYEVYKFDLGLGFPF